MGRDRLQEMQKASKYVKDKDIEANKANGEHEMQPLQQTQNMSPDCAEFFERFQEIITNIEKVEANASAIRRLHAKILYEPAKNPQDDAKLNDLDAETKRLGAKVNNALKFEQDALDNIAINEMKNNIQEANEESDKKSKKSKKNNAKQAHELRLRKTQVSAQSKRFFDMWTTYNNEMVEYRDKQKDQFVRRVKIVNASFSDDQIEDMLEKGDQNIFTNSILQDTRQAKQTLNELQDRHEEFLKLERSIVEIHSLFVEMAALVKQQGETIDVIALNIENAQSKTEEGRKQLQQAEEYKRKARRLKVIIASIIAVVVLIVLLVLLSEFGVFQGSSEVIVVEKVVTVTAKNDDPLSDEFTEQEITLPVTTESS